MQTAVLSVKNLVVTIEHKEILKGFDLDIKPGEVSALMGPNGSGKSTLSQVISGNPDYLVEKGEITLEGKSLVGLDPTERAKSGVFMSFQYPVEIPGVNVASFLRMIYQKRTGTTITPVKFRSLLEEKMKLIDMKPDFTDRYLNQGFSGGEKKRMEILQMLILEPKLVILDEVDSGLDIDALNSVAKGVAHLRQQNPDTALMIITHYARVLHLIKPDLVHIMHSGKIVKSGGFEVAQQLEETGYKDFGPEENTQS